MALLAERGEVLGRLLRLLGLARWPMRYLMQHPGVIDELADARMAHERFDPAAFARDLDERHRAWVRSGEADEGELLDTLRRAHQAETFRTLVRDVEGEITVEQVADDLSALADATLARVLDWAWRHLRQRHREAPRFAVIAYGKLGGKELGYGSDLDIVFLYDDDDERAPEIYAAFARKVITLAVAAHRGRLALRDRHRAAAQRQLRPAGDLGRCLRPLPAGPRQQHRLGLGAPGDHRGRAGVPATPAWPRASRPTRRAVLTAPRDQAALRREVSTMRERVREAHPVRPTRFDVKHSRGGMMDAEFAVQ